MRKTRLGFYSVLTAFLFIVMSCVNVSAGTEVDIGDLDTVVNDAEDSTATYTKGATIYHDYDNYYYASYPVGDGRFHFYVGYTYEDNHASGTDTGEHSFRMTGEHYIGGTTFHCSKSDSVPAFKTDGGESGGGQLSITWDDEGHMQVGDTVIITLSAVANDLSDPNDLATVDPIITITITA